MKRIRDDIYAVSVPLPNNALRAVNAYIIPGDERSLLVDAGFDLPVSPETLGPALAAAGADPLRLDLFITHQHCDHAGGAHLMASPGSAVYSHCQADGAHMDSGMSFEQLGKAAWDMLSRTEAGLPKAGEAEYGEMFERHVSYWPAPEQGYTSVSDGDVINAGRYAFRVIETPGHCATHVCLYDEKSGLLLSGDHVLPTISPNVADLTGASRSLWRYLDSLKKVMDLPVDLVLPAHGQSFRDLRGRCLELMEHHEKRTGNIRALIAGGDETLYDIARHCQWHTDGVAWERLPAGIKFFAYGETLAHLNYMLDQGMISKHTAGGQDRYATA